MCNSLVLPRFFLRFILVLACVLSAPAVAWAAGVARPRITTQPVLRAAVDLGAVAQLRVTATGGAPINYQWRKNGVPISGAVQPILSVSVTDGTAAGSYDVVVVNGRGTVRSKAARLVVNLAPLSPPVGTAMYERITSTVRGETTTEDSSSVFAAGNVWIDPEDSTAQYTYLYRRTGLNRAQISISGSYLDYDIREYIMVTGSYDLIFTRGTLGVQSGTARVTATATAPVGYKPRTLKIKGAGTFSFEAP